MPAGFLVGKLVQNEDTNRRATLFEAVTSAQTSSTFQQLLFQQRYLLEANFSEKQYSTYHLPFLERYLLRAAIFSRPTFP